VANENSADPNNPGGESGATALTVDTIKAAGVPETYLKEGAYDFAGIAKDLGELGTMRSAAVERAKAVPTDGKYDFAVPKDWQRPEGATDEFVKSWKVSDAKMAAFAPFAKELGLSQVQVSKFISNWATADAAEKMAVAKAASDAETASVAALGANGKTRLENLDKALKAQGLGALLDDKSTLAQRVEAFEKIANGAGKLAEKGTGTQTKERGDFDKLTGSQLHRMAIQEQSTRQ
jgi:hypothetical protein